MSSWSVSYRANRVCISIFVIKYGLIQRIKWLGGRWDKSRSRSIKQRTVQAGCQNKSTDSSKSRKRRLQLVFNDVLHYTFQVTNSIQTEELTSEIKPTPQCSPRFLALPLQLFDSDQKCLQTPIFFLSLQLPQFIRRQGRVYRLQLEVIATQILTRLRQRFVLINTSLPFASRSPKFEVGSNAPSTSFNSLMAQPLITKDSQISVSGSINQNTVRASDIVSHGTSRTKRRFIRRAFGELQQGSLRSAIFALMASAMGTGLFSFPWIAKNTGFVFLMLYIFVGGMYSMVAMFLLMSVAQPNKIKSYNELAELAYGKVLKRISEFCVIFYAWGITICFQVVFAKFVLEILEQIFDLDIFVAGSTTEFNGLGTTIRLLTNGGAIALNMIFILKKDLYSLRFITILGTLAVVYNSIVILVTAFVGFTYDKGDITRTYSSIVSQNHDWSGFQWANFSNPWLQLVGFASTIFCYVNHQMIFPMAEELANPTPKRLHKIFTRAHSAEATIYSIVGVMGYLLLCDYEIDSVVLQSITTIPMLIGKCMMLITLFFAVPLNMLPAREMLFSSIGLEKSNRNHIIVCVLLAASSCGIAMGFQNVTTYFGLLGGTAGTMLAGTIPAMCYLKLTPRPFSDPRCIAVLIAYSIMTVCGFTGAFAAVFAVN